MFIELGFGENNETQTNVLAAGARAQSYMQHHQHGPPPPSTPHYQQGPVPYHQMHGVQQQVPVHAQYSR